MDFSHLKTFCTVVEAGSISKAARRLYVTQPAISVKIQELEEHYGVRLLERTNKGITPTEAGFFVYEEGKRILAMLENIGLEIERRRNRVEELQVAAASIIGSYALPCTIFLFKERYPHYNISLQISNSAEVVNRMVRRMVEIGLMEGPMTASLKETLSGEGIFTRWLMRNKLFLVVPNREPYRERESIALEEVLQLPLIIREPGSGIRASLQEGLSEKGLQLDDLKVTMELNTVNAVISAVIAEVGVSFLPKMAIRKELRYKMLKALPVEDLALSHDYTLLYYPNGKKKSHSAFIELLVSKDRGFC